MCKLRFGQMTPLVAAATLASPPVLAALLDAGADMRKDAAYVFGEDACHMRGCVIAGRVENARYLLTRFPEYVSSVPSFAGFCPLNFAFEAGFNQHAMVDTPLHLTLALGTLALALALFLALTLTLTLTLTLDQVDMLLSLGADANHRAAMGFSVVQFGAMMFDVVASALTLTLTLTLTRSILASSRCSRAPEPTWARGTASRSHG